jgi:hypothetical protein
MQHNAPIEEQSTDRVISAELLKSCRNHIETLQNLSYLTSIDAADPYQVRLNVKMMEWHLLNLTEALLVPLRHVATVSAESLPAKRQVSPVTITAPESIEGMHETCKGEFRTAPDRAIWSALLNIADDARLHRLLLKAQRMLRTAQGSTSPTVSLPNAVSDWRDFSAAVKDEENRRLLV